MKLIHKKPKDQREASWYGITTNHYIIRIDGENWFPIHKITGEKNRRFYDKYNLGLVIHGHMGTMHVAVLDLEKTKKLLVINE